jgi:hypothetical protein
MMYMAGVVIVVHSVLPHSHASNLTAEQHSVLHATPESFLDLIQLVLHDYEQLAETFVTRDRAVEFSIPAFIPLIPLVAIFSDIISLEDAVVQLPLPIDEVRLAQLGHVSVWGVRPPPVA